MLCEGSQIAYSLAGVLEMPARGPQRFGVVHPVKSHLKNKTKVQCSNTSLMRLFHKNNCRHCQESFVQMLQGLG